MIHANSNLNVFKKNQPVKSKKSKYNNFNKSSLVYNKNKVYNQNVANNKYINNYNYNNSNNNDYFYHSIDSSIVKTNNSNTLKNNLHNNQNIIPITNKLKQNNCNTINKMISFNSNNRSNINMSGSNNKNSSGKNIYSNSNKNGHINIRLNLNNEIINNNIPIDNINFNSNGKLKNNKKINYNLNNNFLNNNYNISSNTELIEKIKEKDIQINILQKDLLTSQKILNELNNYKSICSSGASSSGYQNGIFDCSKSKSIEKPSKINIKKNNNNKPKKNNFINGNNSKNILTLNYINNNKNNESLSNHYNAKINSPNSKSNSSNIKYFSSSPNNINKCFSKERTSLSSGKNLKHRNIFGKNNEEDININKEAKKNFKDIINKCDELKNKTQIILRKYIELCEYITNSNINSNLNMNINDQNKEN